MFISVLGNCSEVCTFEDVSSEDECCNALDMILNPGRVTEHSSNSPGDINITLCMV